MVPKLPKTSKQIVTFMGQLKKKPESYWIKRGEKMAIGLFQEMAKRVPAYKDFLKKNNVNPRRVKKIEDFKKLVPIIDKNNYLRAYPLEDLCWDGKLSEGQYEFSSTSGSTGSPFYFPRTDYQNEQYAEVAEMYLRTNFDIQKKSTLYINCFALGVWIGGLFTYEAIKIVSKRGKYNLTIINPGLNKPEIFKAIKNLADKYDQVLIGGYPPFIKDVLDEGESQGLKWQNYNVGIIFSAEAFSEEFRDYVARKAGLKDIYRSTLNHYGIVDLGTTSHETPLSVFVRRASLSNKDIYTRVFFQDPSRLPTLAQYLPEMFYFEEVNSGLLCSSASGVPLVRYDLKDYGGIINSEDVKKIFLDNSINLSKELKKNNLSETVWNIPFVYVYERKDMTVVFSGANIYPETIKKVLVIKEFEAYFSGKFNMQIKYDTDLNQSLVINIELKESIEKVDDEIGRKVSNIILERLLIENSEYKVIYQTKGLGKSEPIVKFWPYGYPEFFKSGGKHKWVTK